MGNALHRDRAVELGSFQIIDDSDIEQATYESGRCNLLLLGCQDRLDDVEDFVALLSQQIELAENPRTLASDILMNPDALYTTSTDRLTETFGPNLCEILRRAYPYSTTAPRRTLLARVAATTEQTLRQVTRRLQELEPELQDTRDYLFGLSYYLGAFDPPTRCKVGAVWVFPVFGALSIIAPAMGVSWGNWLMAVIPAVMIGGFLYLVTCYRDNQDGDVKRAGEKRAVLSTLLAQLHAAKADWDKDPFAKALRMRKDLQHKLDMAEYRPRPWF